MYKKYRVVATICARGGSKGVPGKNIRELAGKPLIAYTITQAQASRYIDRIVISTDDPHIKEIAEQWNIVVPFLRPARLATDTAGRVPAVIHAVQKAEKLWSEAYDIVVDLGNVTPLRTPEDIDACIDQLVRSKDTDIVVSVTEPHRNPYFNMLEIKSDGFAQLVKRTKKPLKRRQDAPLVYDMNDAVFAIWKSALFKHESFSLPKRRVYVMPAERSIDIDRPIDFQIAELLMKQKT